jgi:hypothetical protein
MMLAMASSEGCRLSRSRATALGARGDLIYAVVDARLALHWTTRTDRRFSRDVGDRGALAARMTLTPPCGIYHHFFPDSLGHLRGRPEGVLAGCTRCALVSLFGASRLPRFRPFLALTGGAGDPLPADAAARRLLRVFKGTYHVPRNR